VSPTWKEKVQVALAPEWPIGEGRPTNGEVAARILEKSGSIGYVQLNYAEAKKLQIGLVLNQAGVPIKASGETVTAAARGTLKDIPEDLRFSLTNAPGEKAYPIAGTTWAVVYAKLPRGKAQRIADFLRWATHDGQEQAEKLSYVRLPRELVERVEKKLEALAKSE
jgi:phosphate transport system substrate-binding protein